MTFEISSKMADTNTKYVQLSNHLQCKVQLEVICKKVLEILRTESSRPLLRNLENELDFRFLSKLEMVLRGVWGRI